MQLCFPECQFIPTKIYHAVGISNTIITYEWYIKLHLISFIEKSQKYKIQVRCEAIIRSNPDNRSTAELHLACIEGAEDARDKEIKQKAVEGTIGVAAVGLALGLAGMLLKRR